MSQRTVSPHPARKRVLLITIQPPGGGGVQSLIFSKLSPFLKRSRWEFHFCGPDPMFTSVIHVDSGYPAEQLHLTAAVAGATRFSILRHRCPKRSPRRLWFGLVQLFFSAWDALVKRDSSARTLKGIYTSALQAEQRFDFDLIAGKSPDFRVLELAAKLARIRRKPFLAIYDDPYGERDCFGFYPAETDRQSEVLRQARIALFMSPKTRDRYVECRLVLAEQCRTITDSFPSDPTLYQPSAAVSCTQSADPGSRRLQIVHLGNLPEWRPIETLLAAVDNGNQGIDSQGLCFAFYGYVYQHAREQIVSNPRLRPLFRFNDPIDYALSHQVAARSDVLLVVIGVRHLDNQPSKFFDYLGHGKPLLVVGPLGNPIQEIVGRLAVGIYCDVSDPQAIEQGLRDLLANLSGFQAAYEQNRSAVAAYSAEAVALQWLAVLDEAVNSESPAHGEAG